MGAPLRPLLRRAVKMLQPLLAASPISSEWLGPPRGYYHTTEEWAAQARGGRYVQLDPPELIDRTPPRTLDPALHWKFPREPHAAPATFVATIPGGRAAGANATVITPDDRVLLDVSTEYTTAEEHSAFRRMRLPRPVYHHGRVAVLSTIWNDGYFHWLFDTLPRLDLLRRAGLAADRYVVDQRTPFQRETLAMLGIAPAQIISTGQDLHLKARELLVPSLPGLTGNARPRSCAFLREALLSAAQGRAAAPRRIYISRAAASGRRVRDEAALIAWLGRRGFTAVRLEELSCAAQIALFASAEAVVAPHGAGLSNLVFCPPGCRVLELFSPRYVNVCYWALSDLAGLTYAYLLGEGERPPPGVDPHLVADDIVVSLDDLGRALQLLGIG